MKSEAQRVGVALDVLGQTYTPEGVGIWLRGAKTSLDGLSPIGMLMLGDLNGFESMVRRLGDWDGLAHNDPDRWPLPPAPTLRANDARPGQEQGR